MKIHSTHPSVRGTTPIDRQAHRLLAFCTGVALCAMTCTAAHAQSGTFGELTQTAATDIGASSQIRNGLFTHGDENYRLVNTAAFRTAADIGTTEAGSIAQVGFNGCGSCGTACGGSCGGGYGGGYGACGSCGTACGGSCGGGYGGGHGACGSCGTNCGGSCGFSFDPCAPCVPYYYASFDALYMEVDGNKRYSLSPQFRMSKFDYETAGRVTIGGVPNCVDGYEVSYVGRFQWERFGLANSVIGGINTFLMPGSQLLAADLSAFDDADFQTQAYRAEYWSVEANKTCMGWDVAKLLYGVRYIEYDEVYSYFSRDGADTGLLVSGVENQMFGFQVGMDLLYPIGLNAYTDFRTRLGAFVNLAENDFALINVGVSRAANGDDRSEFAGVIELGGGIRYQVGQILSVRVGAELWYLTGIATANSQFSNVIYPLTGSSTSTSDDVLMTGISVGAEMRF